MDTEAAEGLITDDDVILSKRKQTKSNSLLILLMMLLLSVRHRMLLNAHERLLLVVRDLRRKRAVVERHSEWGEASLEASSHTIVPGIVHPRRHAIPIEPDRPARNKRVGCTCQRRRRRPRGRPKGNVRARRGGVEARRRRGKEAAPIPIHTAIPMSRRRRRQGRVSSHYARRHPVVRVPGELVRKTRHEGVLGPMSDASARPLLVMLIHMVVVQGLHQLLRLQWRGSS